MLEFVNVSYKIHNNTIVDNLNFMIPEGSMTAFLGKSGAGKSTIFKLILGEYKATSGEIYYDNTPLSMLKQSSLQLFRRNLGVVFQDYRLLPSKTVYENVAFALEVQEAYDIIPERVSKALDLVGLAGKENRFPKSLSGGEQQRVSLARAIVHAPKILLADEPTGNLDADNMQEIAMILRHLQKYLGLTILLSTHDPAFVKLLEPRIINISNGTIIS